MMSRFSDFRYVRVFALPFLSDLAYDGGYFAADLMNKFEVGKVFVAGGGHRLTNVRSSNMGYVFMARRCPVVPRSNRGDG